ncbi:MAG: flagellar filament capping protein FliD [Desulfovibrio sp.]|nr:flagellar filament capping protein FliD [Desulfovibrio sp.]
MGISISGSNAISGLSGNDTDFDKVLEQLKKIESGQLNRLEAWKSDWNLRYEAFTQIIEQIQAASSMLGQLSDKNNFVTKVVQSTNSGVITAVANAAAQDVQHSFTVSQTASNAIWANTGHVFDSKTDIINKTGTDQYFSYIYAGERHDFKVPANTTLESFASMINNSSDNPGIKVSLIQTGKGYVFQVAGKDTGEANDLYIFDSQLEGMNAAGSTSNWQTNSSMKLDDTLTNPTSYVFDIVLQGGSKKTVTIKGNATADEVVAALNNAAGGINAKFENGQLTMEGVQSFSRREADDKPYVPASVSMTVNGKLTGKLNDAGGIAEGLADGDELTFTATMDDGTTREVKIKADATVRDLMAALGQATQDGDGLNLNSTATSVTGQFAGVTKIEVAAPDGTDLTDKLEQKTTDATGVKNTLGGSLSKAELTISVNADKLSSRLDGLKDGEEATDLVFTIVDKDGNAQNISIKSDATNQELLDKLAALGFTATTDTDADGNVSLKLDNVKELKLSSGGIKEPAYTTSLKSEMVIGATNSVDGSGDLFYTDPASGKITLEKAPDLVYTITTNDGKTGTLTLPSGSSNKDIVAALKNTADPAWTWTEKDGDGNERPATPPADLGVRLTDAEGNELTDLDSITEPVFLNLKDVQTVSGPQLSGQISSSSNWSIQRAQNAKYKIDNWPVEMESATNQISDAIEGVVFTIQDVGEARISVSTDITSVEQSIQNFLDAVNSVLLTVNELMKYDDTKEVTSNDPNDIGNDNYSASGLTNQKGNLLTGNYGVQLFKSRFSSVLGATPPGFKSRQSADDLLSGDVLASLANLGIKTDTDTTSDTYGLLVLAPSSTIAELQSIDKENYNNLITNNLEAVVDFFCASGIGSSTSTDFRYGSHVEGITKAGTYEVTYTVDANGEIQNVMIGGQPAKRDESMPGNYYSVASGDARGLSILIDDLSIGDHPPAGSDPMYVRIKQGLVQTTNNFLKAELVFNDVNISANSTPDQIADAMHLKSQNGALMSLRDNYKKVMESIDVKIEREQRRLDTWYNRQKQIFANLETLLSQYSEQQKSLEGQLAQLSGS